MLQNASYMLKNKTKQNKTTMKKRKQSHPAGNALSIAQRNDY